MRITIDTDGSTITCELYGCVPSASNPNIDQYRSYPFKEADTMSQIIALNAFRVLENEFKKNKKENKL